MEKEIDLEMKAIELDFKETEFERKVNWTLQTVMRNLTNLVCGNPNEKLRDLTRLNLELFKDLTLLTKLEKEIEELQGLNFEEKEGK